MAERRGSHSWPFTVAAGLIIGAVEAVLAMAFAALVFGGLLAGRMPDGIGLYMGAAALTLGACGAGIFPAVSMLSARLFDQQSLPRIIGLYSPVTLPLTFFLPPLAGVWRDAMGSYTPVVAIMIGGCVLVTMVFVAMARGRAHRAVPLAVAQPGPDG